VLVLFCCSAVLVLFWCCSGAVLVLFWCSSSVRLLTTHLRLPPTHLHFRTGMWVAHSPKEGRWQRLI
jgi:hypothetical protein